MRENIKIWTARYLPAEIGSSTMAILAAFVVKYFDGSDVWLALFATWAEVFTFYLFILAKEVRGVKTFAGFIKKSRNLLLEFGFAECIDAIIRPFCIYFGIQLIPNLALGILAGKVIADIIFYTLTIAAFEAIKRWVR